MSDPLYNKNSLEMFNKVSEEYHKKYPNLILPIYLIADKEAEKITIEIFEFLKRFPNRKFNVTPERINAFKSQAPTVSDEVIAFNLAYWDILHYAFDSSISFAIREKFHAITYDVFIHGLDALKCFNIPNNEINTLKNKIVLAITGANKTDNGGIQMS